MARWQSCKKAYLVVMPGSSHEIRSACLLSDLVNAVERRACPVLYGNVLKLTWQRQNSCHISVYPLRRAQTVGSATQLSMQMPAPTVTNNALDLLC